MRVKAAIKGQLKQYIRQEEKLAGGATRTAAKRASGNLKREADRQMRRAGIREFKRGKAEWWRRAVVDTRRDFGLDTKGIVFSSFSKAALTFEEGAVIRAKSGRWLAIPAEGLVGLNSRLSSAGLKSNRSGNNSLRIKSGALGLPGPRSVLGGTLQFKPSRKPGVAMLVLRRPGKDDVVMYWLKREVRIKKKINFYQAAEKWGNEFPKYLVTEWERRAKRGGIE